LTFLLLNLLTLFTLRSDSLNLVTSFGKFQNAGSISASREEFVFVSDIQTNQIYKYSKNGDKLQTFGGTGSGNNQLNNPASIDASNGLDVFVADYQNNRIQRYDIKLHYVATFDFNIYNLTADISKKIYYPYGIAFLNTSEIFVLVDAGNFRVAKLRSFDEVNMLFGSSFGFDRILRPGKLIKGNALSIYILDKETDEVLNFDNYGTFVSKIKNPETAPIISIAFLNDNLYIMNYKSIISYDLKKKQFDGLNPFSCGSKENVIDCTFLDKEYFLILTDKKVYKFKIT
jgi:NHL repeat-containing protein